MNALHAAVAAAVLALSTMGAAPSPAPAPSPDAVVQIRDFAFKPSKLQIRTGETVLFINDDGDAHTVTSNDKSFDSGGLDTNDHWSHTFTRPGTYSYFCALHPYMKAVVVVTDAPK